MPFHPSPGPASPHRWRKVWVHEADLEHPLTGEKEDWPGVKTWAGQPPKVLWGLMASGEGMQVQVFLGQGQAASALVCPRCGRGSWKGQGKKILALSRLGGCRQGAVGRRHQARGSASQQGELQHPRPLPATGLRARTVPAWSLKCQFPASLQIPTHLAATHTTV